MTTALFESCSTVAEASLTVAGTDVMVTLSCVPLRGASSDGGPSVLCAVARLLSPSIRGSERLIGFLDSHNTILGFLGVQEQTVNTILVFLESQ